MPVGKDNGGGLIQYHRNEEEDNLAFFNPNNQDDRKEILSEDLEKWTPPRY